MLAVHVQLMSNNAKSPVMMGQTDIVARLTKRLYGGAKIVYDDKAKAFDMQKYGFFWKAQKNFLIGLEYNQVGDRQFVDASFNHKINKTTSVGNTVSYDIVSKKISSITVLEKMLEAGSTVKAKVDSNGIYDLSLTADLSS